jgi:hypothetical protein
MAKSPRSYSDKTLKILWGRSAGRCNMPNCRIEVFINEHGYDPVWNIGEMGHIFASSDSGPRPNKKLTKFERDEYVNLILLCRNCHGRIDGLSERYPSELLKEIKKGHEAWVRASLPDRGFSSIKWKVISFLGNQTPDMSTIPEALSPDQESEQLHLKVTESESWLTTKADIQSQLEAVIVQADALSSRVAIFPLAPVSACIFAGYLLTNRIYVRAYQYHRDVHSWAWPKSPMLKPSPNCQQVNDISADMSEVYFHFELSAQVRSVQAQRQGEGAVAVYKCSVPNPSTEWLCSREQLDELARKSRNMFEDALEKYPTANRWHIFYAGPAPGAITVGQQLNPTMIPEVQLYEYEHPNHIPSLCILKQDSPLRSNLK